MSLLETSEHVSPLKRLINRLMAAGLTLLVICVIWATFTLFHLDRMVEQLELKSYDLRTQIQWGDSAKRPSSDIVILQFDDPSLNVLNDEFGLWPWPRDVHARMIHFLNKIGVRSMLYDIMFVAHRKGSEDADQMLVDTFHQYDNVYLSMNFDSELAQSQKLGKDLTPKDIERLLPLTISVHSELDKAPDNTTLQLQKDPDGTVFFANNHMTFNHYRSIMPELLDAGKNIGIINHGADDDGVSRSNPLFFRFQYYPFVKTAALPLKQQQGYWYDAQGARTDADGYLLQKSQYLPVVPLKDGSFLDRNPSYPQPVDREGYLMDGYGHSVYQRDMTVKTLYFPYLGLRAALNLKFPNKMPELLVDSKGHLKFEGYDIPLSANGDFIVNWYNVSLAREEQTKSQRELRNYIDVLNTKITGLEDDLARVSASSKAAVEKSKEKASLQSAIKEQREELQKATSLLQFLNESLQGEFVPQPYRMISAWEVIRTMKKDEAGLPMAPEDVALKNLLHNKIVFVGATAVAAYDIKNTSIHSSMPGVILQASLFDNLYQNDGRYMHRLHPELNLLITALICLLAAGLTLKIRSALAGMLTVANIAVLYVLLAIVMYQSFTIWINIAMPLVSLVVTTTLTFMLKYILRNKDYEKTYALATTDSMTGLYNHRFFQEHMRRSIEQASRFKHKFSLVLIDIDFFKKFNDTYGHQAGDEVLRHVARKLKKTVRTIDIVARYGGEEMAIILDRATEEEALAVAQKIVKAVAEEAYPIADGVAKHVTISCGVATYPTHGQLPSQMIEFADAGLYRAKENGRNQVGSQSAVVPPPSEGTSASSCEAHQADDTSSTPDVA